MHRKGARLKLGGGFYFSCFHWQRSQKRRHSTNCQLNARNWIRWAISKYGRPSDQVIGDNQTMSLREKNKTFWINAGQKEDDKEEEDGSVLTKCIRMECLFYKKISHYWCTKKMEKILLRVNILNQNYRGKQSTLSMKGKGMIANQDANWLQTEAQERHGNVRYVSRQDVKYLGPRLVVGGRNVHRKNKAVKSVVCCVSALWHSPNPCRC